METEVQNPKIIIPEEWSKAAYTIACNTSRSPPPVVLICGPKNAGKTTFSRHLISTFLSSSRKVVYLETDVGQSEFTPPGLVSLTAIDDITPDFTIPCLKGPWRSFFFGDVSSKKAPATYLNYISALYQYYKEEYCMCNKNRNPGKIELPLVVNTPGWVKGIGYNILLDMVKMIAPSHVVKMNVFDTSRNLPPGAFWMKGDTDGTKTLIEINSVSRDSFDRSTLVQKDSSYMREIRIMDYFKQCIPNNIKISTVNELAHKMASHPPYEISVSSITVRHLHYQVASTEIFYSLNATIVGLAISSKDSELPLCVGLAIVRGIDTSRNLLYVLTPVPPSTLEKVDLFLQGLIQIPPRLLQVAECRSPYISTNALPTKRTPMFPNLTSGGQ